MKVRNVLLYLCKHVSFFSRHSCLTVLLFRWTISWTVKINLLHWQLFLIKVLFWLMDGGGYKQRNDWENIKIMVHLRDRKRLKHWIFFWMLNNRIPRFLSVNSWMYFSSLCSSESEHIAFVQTSFLCKICTRPNRYRWNVHYRFC